MNLWHDNPDGEDVFDPLCIERSSPIEDQEAELVEALCRAATPGPLVVDDQADGDGAAVVSLPDGRMIVSLAASVDQTRDEAVTDANAELICKARYLLLRLLRDRQQWKEQREFLLQRIRTLEAALNLQEQPARREDFDAAGPVPPRPR